MLFYCVKFNPFINLYIVYSIWLINFEVDKSMIKNYNFVIAIQLNA